MINNQPGDGNPPHQEEQLHGSDSSGDETENDPPLEDGQIHLPRRRPTQPPQVDEALNYLRQIKREFENDVPVYHTFLQIMSDFRAERVQVIQVVQQVVRLLSDYPDLVISFNTFLPTGYTITYDNLHYVVSQPHGPSVRFNSPEAALREDGGAFGAEVLDHSDQENGSIEENEEDEENN